MRRDLRDPGGVFALPLQPRRHRHSAPGRQMGSAAVFSVKVEHRSPPRAPVPKQAKARVEFSTSSSEDRRRGPPEILVLGGKTGRTDLQTGPIVKQQSHRNVRLGITRFLGSILLRFLATRCHINMLALHMFQTIKRSAPEDLPPRKDPTGSFLLAFPPRHRDCLVRVSCNFQGTPHLRSNC